jgi:dihydroorotase
VTKELLIVNGRILDPANHVDEVRHLAIVEGRIAEVSARPFDRARLAAADVLDAARRWVMPGFVDLHVHLREPGEEYKETIASGTRAAVAGGFTAVVAMPNTKPVNDSAAVTSFVLSRASEAGLARVFPAGAISKGLRGEELSEVGDLVAAGCCCITDDGRPVMNASLMRRALEYARTFEIPVMVHEEDLQLSGNGVMNEGPLATRLGLPGIPTAAEEAMVSRDIALAELTGGRLHIAHVSCAGSVRAVRDARRRGVKVTAEAAPHHFALTEAAVLGYDTHAKMNPPLRSARDRAAVLEGLSDGTVDAIATDHAPHSTLEKDLEFDQAANGVIGLETALPLTLALVRGSVIAPLRAVELLSSGPARIFNLPGGSLARGARADVAVVDPEEEWVCEPSRFFSKGRNSPFAGWKLKGRVKMTLVGGQIVHREP